MGCPHVVILGAGASRAALPHGDRHGRMLPLMDDLVDVLDVRPLLEQHGVDSPPADFELLYSRLADEREHPDLLSELERRIRDYFLALQLPDHPTLYDRLVLSLRPKDVIASFNWDPLLWQALTRLNNLFGPDILPQALFLHGNVAVGHCLNHEQPTQGCVGQDCQKCGRPLAPSRLLFPVTHKDYAGDAAISRYWQAMRQALDHAYFLTVFGYRAPKSDAEAMELMQKAWGGSRQRDIEQVEVVDIRPSEELAIDWKQFIHKTHYATMPDFCHSYLAKHPRRSCETFWATAMQLCPQPERPLPPSADWGELVECVRPLMDQEWEQRASNPPQVGHE